MNSSIRDVYKFFLSYDGKLFTYGVTQYYTANYSTPKIWHEDIRNKIMSHYGLYRKCNVVYE